MNQPFGHSIMIILKWVESLPSNTFLGLYWYLGECLDDEVHVRWFLVVVGNAGSFQVLDGHAL